MDANQIMIDTKQMIDDLKTVCANFGIGNGSSEYKIITEVFLYKFLNDKFLHDIREVSDDLKNSKNIEADLAKLSDDDYDELLMLLPPDTAKLKCEHFISHLYNNKNQEKFNELFDNTLVDIANFNIQIFSVKAGENPEDRIKLFEPISVYIIDTNNKSNFCRALVDKIVEFSFDDAFEQKYDFFSVIFEYLIKDYNKDFGKYGEYYTPHSIASIIAKIMVPHGDQNVTVYDPAAGSGTLLLALAHEIGEANCTIYAQDISQKSNEFLRLNLILNNLVHSLANAIHGDTLVNPRHLSMKFDYIVSNPPFGVDFSDNRDSLAAKTERFWAGVPNIPQKNKEKMAIYLLFVQHIINSLGDKGKAAIVVPTGFLTANASIQKKIRKLLVEDEPMLRGVISMPSNIFATTGTNVSILFVDKEKTDDKVILVDASNFGTKVKLDGKNQKTVLSDEEITKIISTFTASKVIDDFSVVVDYKDIIAKKYSFSAGQYFEVKIEFEELTSDEFDTKIEKSLNELDKLFNQNKKLEIDIKNEMRVLKYENH